MSAVTGPAIERLARVMAMRQRQFAVRVVVAAVVAGLFFGFTGWLFATAWFVAYVGLQLAEMKVFTGVEPLVFLRRPGRYHGALLLLGFNTLLFGAFGLEEAMKGGSWGVCCACLLWAGSIMNSVVVSNGSKDAFVYQAAPSAVFYLTAPLLSMAAGAAWIDGGAVVLAGALNLMVGATVWAASQKLFEAETAAQAELERRRQEAEAATAAKSSFVAMVSHELRTPISAILAGAGEVERRAADPLVRSSGLLIADSARMMRTLLNDLLDLSKIEAGHMSVEAIPYDLRSALLDTVRFWTDEVRKKGLRLRLQGASEAPRFVVGDPTRLRQILNNLLSNAIKFTSEGSVTLSIRARPEAGGLCRLAFEVKDTGRGMTAEKIGRLFQAFEQLGASTARTHGGTGLGLAISRDLARLMGGDLTAESVEGRGSSFTLTLLLPLAAHVPQDDQGLDRPVPEGAPLRVLIVDDHEVNRRAFTLMLQAAGAAIATAEDGLGALEALSNAVFDMVLMDVNMPQLNGLDAVARLRTSEGPNAATPVIALTASGDAETAAECLAAGMDAVVTKPVESRELFAAIEEVLNAARPPSREIRTG